MHKFSSNQLGQRKLWKCGNFHRARSKVKRKATFLEWFEFDFRKISLSNHSDQSQRMQTRSSIPSALSKRIISCSKQIQVNDAKRGKTACANEPWLALVLLWVLHFLKIEIRLACVQTFDPLLLCALFHSRSLRRLKVVWYPKMDQKVCLNMVKKDQLCAIALKKRN